MFYLLMAIYASLHLSRGLYFLLRSVINPEPVSNFGVDLCFAAYFSFTLEAGGGNGDPPRSTASLADFTDMPASQGTPASF